MGHMTDAAAVAAAAAAAAAGDVVVANDGEGLEGNPAHPAAEAEAAYNLHGKRWGQVSISGCIMSRVEESIE